MKRISILLALLAVGTPAWAGIAFVQTSGACETSTASTTLTCSFPNPVAAGDVLIAYAMPVLSPAASAFPASLSDSLGQSWTQVDCFSAYGAQADFFYFANSAAGSDTATLTYNLSSVSPTAQIYLSIAEYSGGNRTTPFDAGPTCSGFSTATSFTGPNLTTTQSSDMLISGLAIGNGGTTTITAPYTERVSELVTLADDAPGSAGAQAGPTWTIAYSGDGFTIGAALNAAAVAVAGTPQVGAFSVGP